MKLYKGIIFCLATLGLAACSDNEFVDTGDNVAGMDDNASNEVVLNISLEGVSTGTRAEDVTQPADPTNFTPTISTGTQLDQLVYAIYSRNLNSANDVAYTLDEIYGDKNSNYQISVNLSQTEVEGMKTDTPYKGITFKVSPNKEYKVACWAQSSECEAYTTTDLEAVKVSYENAINNDENRDAFCGVTEFKGNVRYQTVKVTLRRPFAQINIGTSGADYANLIYDPALLPHGLRMTESTITVEGLADTYNVLTGEVNTSSDKLSAKFAWAKLPAWYNVNVPTLEEGKVYTVDNDPFVKTEEEFLLVNLNGDEVFYGYKTEYPTVYKNQDTGEVKYLTETFKYLSMCYVLPLANNEEGGSTVSVTFNFQQDGNNPITLTEKTLENVPVQANYRTNILGGLYTTDDVPDPTSIFSVNSFQAVIHKEFDSFYVGGPGYLNSQNGEDKDAAN